jgi:hypothetical protein
MTTALVLALVLMTGEQGQRPTITSVVPQRTAAGGHFDVILEVPKDFFRELRVRFYRVENGKAKDIQREEKEIRDQEVKDLDETPGVVRIRVTTDDNWRSSPPRQSEDQRFFVVLLVIEVAADPVVNLDEKKEVRVGPPMSPLDDAALIGAQIDRLAANVGTLKSIGHDNSRRAQFSNEIVMLKRSAYRRAAIDFDGLVVDKMIVEHVGEGELVSTALSVQLDAARAEAERAEVAVQAVEDTSQKQSLLGRLKGLLDEINLVAKLVKD